MQPLQSTQAIIWINDKLDSENFKLQSANCSVRSENGIIPVRKLSSIIYTKVTEELALNSKLRLILEAQDNGLEAAQPFSEEEEQMLNELKGLDEQALMSLQIEIENKLYSYQELY
jgi:hypothetical protein